MSQLSEIKTAAPKQWQNCTGCGQPFDFNDQNFPNLGSVCKECHANRTSSGMVERNDRRRRNAVEGFLDEVKRGVTGSALEELHADVVRMCGGRTRTAELAHEILMGAVESARDSGRWKTAIDAYKAIILNPLIAADANRPKKNFDVTEEEADAIIREVMLRDAGQSDETLRRLAEQKGFRLIPASGHASGEEVRNAS